MLRNRNRDVKQEVLPVFDLRLAPNGGGREDAVFGEGVGR